jgi:hypothetical protein
MEKTNVPGLFKDRKTIINTNEGDFNRIKATRDKAKELLRMKLDIAILQEQVQKLTERLAEMPSHTITDPGYNHE